VRSRSLGPFPKTRRWQEFVVAAGGSKSQADRLLGKLQRQYSRYCSDAMAYKAISFLVALPVATRTAHPVKALCDLFKIEAYGGSRDDLFAAINRFLPGIHPCKTALLRTVCAAASERSDDLSLFESDPWRIWREYDGSPFCDLARAFYTELNYICFAAVLRRSNLKVSGSDLRLFAEEMSLITRAFSARWFNACARYQIPDPGSISWYLGHCMGKLDLELSRELSTWIEPEGNPWRRRKATPLRTASLPL